MPLGPKQYKKVDKNNNKKKVDPSPTNCTTFWGRPMCDKL